MTEFVGVALISAASAYVLDTLGFRGTRLYLGFVSLVMLIVTLDGAGELLNSLFGLGASKLALDIGGVALKVLGLGYIGGFFSDFCMQLGAVSVADGLTLFTRVEILSAVMPYFLNVVKLSGELFV